MAPRRVPERLFRELLPRSVFSLIFRLFFVKTCKKQKMKKCVSICKLHTILEVAPSKKIRCLREKTLSIQARFSVKNRAKIGAESDSKWQRQEKPTKTASGAVSGRTFASPGSFSVDFGVPAGRQNGQKTAPERQYAYFLTSLFRFSGVLFRSPLSALKIACLWG